MDGKKRQDKVAMNRNISDSVPGKTVTDGIPVSGRCTDDNEDDEVGVCKTASI
jgi:hypothetical protein